MDASDDWIKYLTEGRFYFNYECVVSEIAQCTDSLICVVTVRLKILIYAISELRRILFGEKSVYFLSIDIEL